MSQSSGFCQAARVHVGYGARPSEERVHPVCVILSRIAALDACSEAANRRRVVLCII